MLFVGDFWGIFFFIIRYRYGLIDIGDFTRKFRWFICGVLVIFFVFFFSVWSRCWEFFRVILVLLVLRFGYYRNS